MTNKIKKLIFESGNISRVWVCRNENDHYIIYILGEFDIKALAQRLAKDFTNSIILRKVTSEQEVPTICEELKV